MPLQIRRGTEAERTAMTVPLAAGELLYVTNTQRIYVGTGSALGGIAVTGYTNEDAQDAVAPMFTGGSHTGISFTYNDTLNTISATVDLSAFEGPVVADSVKGSVFADDSTLLVDGVSGTIVAPVFADVTGNLTGNVVGNVTGNTTGYHTGDIKGSVFADDSTIIVDGLSNKVSASLINATTFETSNLSIASNSITASSDITVTLSSTFDDTVTIKGITDGTFGSQMSSLIISGSKGTLDTPTNTAAGDYVGRITLNGYYGGQYKSMASIVAGWDTTANLSDTYPSSNITLITGGGGSSHNYAVFNDQGVFYAPMLMTGSYATGSYPSVPSGPTSAGIIIFDSTTSQFMGYNGSTWVQLS